MRVLVCGGRAFLDHAVVHGVLDGLHRKHVITTIIHGNARGADSLADDWAASARVQTLTFLPAWEEHGKAAGPIRNQKMLDEGKPDMVVEFPGGRGTADMAQRAKTAGVPIMKIEVGATGGTLTDAHASKSGGLS